MEGGSRAFAFRYLVWLAFLFFLLYFDTNPISHWINEAQRSLLLDALRWVLGEDRIRGVDILAHPKFRIIVTRACNGLIPFYLYMAGVLAFPYVHWFCKILWGVVGYGILSTVNLGRLLFVTSMTQRAPENFHWSHDIAGNLILMSAGLSLYWIYLRFGIDCDDKK